jgi:outer membrane receptor for ferrienterochelin and colicin
LEIGLRASNFSSRVFTIWNKDEILFDANDSSQSIFGSNINVDKTHRVGADIEVTFSPWRETDVTTQIAYVDTKIKAGSFAGSEIPGVSKTQAGMTVNTNLTDTVRVNLSHRWYSSAYAITDYENDLGRHNGYTTTAASLTFIQPEWLFGFSVKNLFDVTHDSYVYDSYGTLKRTPAEPISFWLTFKYTPE